jgi:hypothetical protein
VRIIETIHKYATDVASMLALVPSVPPSAQLSCALTQSSAPGSNRAAARFGSMANHASKTSRHRPQIEIQLRPSFGHSSQTLWLA